jgi:hypothetical protein
MVDAYCTDPNTDFHQMVADMAGIKRKAAKTIGLGLMYGMGKNKLAAQLDLDVSEASELIDKFHLKVPFLRGTVNAVMKRIEHPAAAGSIRTLLGRKCRFPLWEPMEWGVNKALPREQAVIEYGVRIKRAGTYKGLNRLIQGSAADQTKAGMVALAKAGFTLLLQVHDEVVISADNREHAQAAAEITLVLPTADVFDDIALEVAQAVADDVVPGLDRLVLVMTTTNLHCIGRRSRLEWVIKDRNRLRLQQRDRLQHLLLQRPLQVLDVVILDLLDRGLARASCQLVGIARSDLVLLGQGIG